MKAVDFLVVGLGNPGDEYHSTRHNFGFLAIDRLAYELGISLRHLPLLQAEAGVGELSPYSLVLAKPITFMNASGHAVAALTRFFQLKEPGQLIVIHDDLDIPLGKIKIKSGGGAGGHKGVNSIIDSLGTGEFKRVRLGIGFEKRPEDVVDYVLAPFSGDEQVLVQQVLAEADAATRMIIQQGLEKAMNHFHRQGS